MTTLLPLQNTEPFYPSGYGQPVAETYDHFYVLAIVLEVLRQFRTVCTQLAQVFCGQFFGFAARFN